MRAWGVGLRAWGSRAAAGTAGLAASAAASGFAALAFAAAPAAAQEPVPVELTFERAVEVALERNPAYARSVNEVESAELGERQALGRLLPSLSASMSFTGSTTRNKTAVDPFGQPLEQETFVESTSSRTSQGVSGNVTLFDLQSVRDLGAARAQSDAQRAVVDLRAAELRTQVGRAYFQAVQRQRLIGVEEQGLATARDQLAAIRQLLRMAAKQPTDVLGAELAAAQAEQALAQARGEARKALLVLRETMGVALGSEFELASGFPEVFDPGALDLATLLERASSGSPRVLQALAGVEAADRSLSAARAARYPSLSANYNWGRGATLRDYGAFGEFNPQNSGWGFGFSVGLPVFSGFQNAAAVGRADVQAANARETLREARLALEREVRSALIDLENAYTGVRLAETSAGIARERLAQGQELYRLGTLDYTALSQMIEQVANAERQVINARFQFADALLQLEEKVGGPVGG